jgi:hypothetical protein
MEKLITKIRTLKFDNKLLVFSFIFLGVISFFLEFKTQNQPVQPPQLESSKSVDTFIPLGYVLIPIEITNAESLSSLIGELGGVIDLYLTAKPDAKSGSQKKVASKIKILRAPLNPQQYAILIKESESSLILSQSGPFTAVVQNPASNGTEVTQNKRNLIHIQYQD